MGLLASILESKRRSIASMKGEALPPCPPARPFDLKRGRGDPLRLIAEVKRRSPSAGVLSTVLGVGQRAHAYERAGAAAVSILCDGEFFGGAYEHLAEARASCTLPLLCKDFVLDEIQLAAARAHGADAVLLIARCLSVDRLVALAAAARARDLEPVVEATREEEVEAALVAGARVIGVNARDLDTLRMDTARAERVVAAVPRERTAIALSGLACPTAVARVANGRADAALVGEALMRRDDPGPLLREMVAACTGERER